MRLAEDKKGLCGCTAPFCMAVSCVPAFIRAGVSVMRSCHFASSSGWEKMDIQANAEKKGSLICEYGKEGLFLPCNETNAMTVTFEETYLQELYEKGKTSDKKHRYQPDIVRRYQKCIRYLKVAPSIEKLRMINSLNYEVLKGDKRGISSIRVNDKYRVEFTVRESIEEPIVTVCNIIDLSNHYK